ncbi:MAG: glycosyltransferase, partial [Oscillospiraceae bacterium]|nr:glycosyltransferase [Oscillospiraceae bacterium]
MKILITSDWYSPAVNGVVTSVKNLRRELERRGHEVRVLTLSQTHRSWAKDGVTYLGS